MSFLYMSDASASATPNEAGTLTMKEAGRTKKNGLLQQIPLFLPNADRDQALVEWLQAHETHPRCGVLLQQIGEWTGVVK